MMRFVREIGIAEAIPPRRFAAFAGREQRLVKQASAGAAVAGVCISPGPARPGRSHKVVVAGKVEVEFGEAVAAGAAVTSDLDGRAVTAAPELPPASIAGYAIADVPAGGCGAVFLGTPLRQAPLG